MTTVTSVAPNGRAVPTANLPVGSVEQVAAKVVPSVVKLETKMGRQSEEGSGIILTEDGLILTNSHVVADANGCCAERVSHPEADLARPPARRAERSGGWQCHDHHGDLRRRSDRAVHRRWHRSGQ